MQMLLSLLILLIWPLLKMLIIVVLFLSLTKDMTGKEDVYRGPAIRALCRITDVSLYCQPTPLFTRDLIHIK